MPQTWVRWPVGPPPSAASWGLSLVCRHLSVPHVVTLLSTWPRTRTALSRHESGECFRESSCRGIRAGDGESFPLWRANSQPGVNLTEPIPLPTSWDPWPPRQPPAGGLHTPILPRVPCVLLPDSSPLHGPQANAPHPCCLRSPHFTRAPSPTLPAADPPTSGGWQSLLRTLFFLSVPQRGKGAGEMYCPAPGIYTARPGRQGQPHSLWVSNNHLSSLCSRG